MCDFNARSEVSMKGASKEWRYSRFYYLWELKRVEMFMIRLFMYLKMLRRDLLGNREDDRLHLLIILADIKNLEPSLIQQTLKFGLRTLDTAQ